MNKKLAALSVVLLSVCLLSFHAQAQTSCSNASLSGNYFYLFDGHTITSSSSSPYVELGKFTSDGNGNVTSGLSYASAAGTITQYTFTGTYTFSQGTCAGSLALLYKGATSAEQFPFTLVAEGNTYVLVFSTPNEVIAGHAYRSASQGASQCGTTSLSGNYGYLFSGVMAGPGSGYFYSNAGVAVADGNGNMNTTGVANIGSGSMPITGTGTYTIGSDCSGHVSLTNSIGTTNYNLALLEGGSVLFMASDQGYTISGTADLQTPQMVLPQLALGGGWYSALYFTNATSAAVSFTVSFTADNGTALTVPGLGAASTQVNIAAGGTAIVEAPNTGSLIEGYATFTLPAGVSGYGVFRQSVTGLPDQEAVVPFAPANATSSTLVWDETNFITGVAIVNPSPVAANISITVMDNNGNALGTSSMTLPAYQKTENALRGFLGLAGVVGLRGRAQFAATSGSVAVLGLRFKGTAFTSIPTTQP